MSVTLPTALTEKAQEILSLRQKQAERFEAIKSVESPDEKRALKGECEAGLREIDEKSAVYEDEVKMFQAEQANKAAIEGAKSINGRLPFSAQGGNITTGQDPEKPYKSLGQLVTEVPNYSSYIKAVQNAPIHIDLQDVDVQGIIAGPADHAMKTTMTTTAGWAPFGFRQPGFVPMAIRTPTFADLIPRATIESPIFYYMEETTFTNNAAYVEQGATKPESAFALTSRTVEAGKIATTLPVSEELLADIPQARTYIDNRGTLQIQLAEEDALLNWDAGSEKWDGFLVKSGVQTQAKGSDPTPTAILKGMVKVQYSPGFAGMATGLAMNPVDWQNVLTLQESTGAYIWSMPSAPTAMPEMRMWGMTVRPVVAMTLGTALLGNFQMFSQIWDRAGLSIRMAWANDDALKNLIRLIFEERLALQITRAAAFVKVTGL